MYHAREASSLVARYPAAAPLLRRHVALTLLAPDIVELIVAGKEPSGLSLERLVRAMPVGWAAQRDALLQQRTGTRDGSM